MTGEEGALLRTAFEELAGGVGGKVAALVSGELGGINGVAPVAWAARAGLALVDADLIGRAFPRLEMTVPHLKGRRVGPLLVTDERGNTCTFQPASPAWAERHARSVVVAMGGAATMALYPMTAAEARDSMVAGSVSRA